MSSGHWAEHSSNAASRDWHIEAVRRIDTDFNRSADTHLVKLRLPAFPEFDLYFKDESTHTTGSLKHRLARSLFLYGLCNGRIREDTTIIEASSGSTAVSEAYFAQLLELPFVAVMPKSTSPEKIAQIEFYQGRCHLIDAADQVGDVSKQLAIETGGHFMDQFTYAERATDWRGNNNIAVSILEQLSKERYPEPAWIICGAGTGGTSATIGRYIRYTGHRSRICVVDPEDSVFYDFFRTGDCRLHINQGSKIEGIGRPCVEASFIPEVVDRMIKVPDAASIAAIRVLETLLGRRCGGSTGTNLYGTLGLMKEMRERGAAGSLVTLICDSGARYQSTYFDDRWVDRQGYRIEPYVEQITRFVEDGVWLSVDEARARSVDAQHVPS